MEGQQLPSHLKILLGGQSISFFFWGWLKKYSVISGKNDPYGFTKKMDSYEPTSYARVAVRIRVIRLFAPHPPHLLRSINRVF